MMAAMKSVPDLIDRLPTVRGSLQANAPLAKYVWFRTGGPADILFQPESADDLADFLRGKPSGVPVTILGTGSNVLIRDGGISGVVIRLGKAFSQITVDGEHVHVGGGALDANVAKAARVSGLDGLSFLYGIPGTIGGSVRMNAGAYGSEIKDVLVSADVVDGQGQHQTFTRDDLGLSYRHSTLPSDAIVVSAMLQGSPGDRARIAARMDDIQEAREATQPIRTRTGGSTFKNPDGYKAWELVDAAGCRGLQMGAAQVSEKHTNFLVNTGGASARDIEALGEEVRRRVKAHSGVTLEWEIRRIGNPAEPSVCPTDPEDTP